MSAGAAPASLLPAAASVSQPTTATPVVQPLPEHADPHRALSLALARLARNPRDIEALQQAGDAALALGDIQAAIGFLSRADRLLPYNPRIMAGLASARLRGQDPVTAIALYEDAANSGALTGDQIADRGLAYDLVSDNITAQRYYREALAAGAGDEAARRLALSLAIMGDRRAVDVVLAPLLQKQDRAAWRIRAFAFAILGREEEAVAIANSTMPMELAAAMAPYLRYMRKLTPAQQAAAANLGWFPQASQIGQENPRIAEWIANHGIKRSAIVDRPLVPVGEPLGGKVTKTADARKDRRKPKPQPEPETMPEAAPPEPTPSREASAPVPVELAAADAEAPPVRKAQPAPKPVAAPPPPRVVGAAPAAVAGFDLAKVTPAPTHTAPAIAKVDAAPRPPVKAETMPEPMPEPKVEAAPAPQPRAETRPVEVAPLRDAVREPAPKPASKPAPVRKASFAELFEEFGKAPVAATPSAGAVDIRKITAPRPAPKAPPPPAHPSRIWVQVGVGRDTDRIAFDWRKLTRDAPDLFKAHKLFVSEWGRTNRLLVGPFETEAAAKAYNDKLHKADREGTFVWTSPAGQVVDSLDGK
jgi:tetratricopeptide (TPR) repeat protein